MKTQEKNETETVRFAIGDYVVIPGKRVGKIVDTHRKWLVVQLADSDETEDVRAENVKHVPKAKLGAAKELIDGASEPAVKAAKPAAKEKPAKVAAAADDKIAEAMNVSAGQPATFDVPLDDDDTGEEESGLDLDIDEEE